MPRTYPPRTAPAMLPNPPITAAMNALRTGVKPMYGLICPAWTE